MVLAIRMDEVEKQWTWMISRLRVLPPKRRLSHRTANLTVDQPSTGGRGCSGGSRGRHTLRRVPCHDGPDRWNVAHQNRRDRSGWVEVSASGQPSDPSIGLSGLAALRNLLEQGFDVTAYERNVDLGGLWRWRDDKSQTTVLKSGPSCPIVLNSPSNDLKHAQVVLLLSRLSFLVRYSRLSIGASSGGLPRAICRAFRSAPPFSIRDHHRLHQAV